MGEIVLHVYPDAAGLYRMRDKGSDIHRSSGSSTSGLRAAMVYIYGTRDDWALPLHARWLRESVMTRLVDDNPARVVWNTTHA
jgi:hypothetical protein